MISAFSSMYGVGVRLRNHLYDNATLRANRLQGPVISVGNISVGGSGKTPFVIALGSLLKQRGIEFDVLSRGYGRRTSGVTVVDPNGDPRIFGDEPILIARKLNIPVVVGGDRYQAGQKAEKLHGPRLHLLDDGFQHRGLHRQFDIVLLADDDFTGKLLPVGRLREPLTSLRRADAIVVNGDFADRILENSGKMIWKMTRKFEIGEAPSRPLAFCGIAKPKRFFADLASREINSVAEMSFRDHHRYSASDIQRILRKAKASNANGFITTEKDLINLRELSLQLNPLQVAKVTLHWDDSATAFGSILSVLKQRLPEYPII